MPGYFTMRGSWTDARAMYLIRVLGELDSAWLDYFGDISLAVNTRRGESSVTTLCAHAADQAAVLGILNSLYQFGYPLLSLQLVQAF
ncbi:MAG: hypothetical protein HDKAJFGB_03875 [Anaerolineae bacterium]|nr:hypothetical protein [Anaerolineae bacterium]